MLGIKGIEVILHEKKEIGKNNLKEPEFETNKVSVSNVLVTPATNDDLIENLSLEGKKAVYILSLPKGDNHNWLDSKVEFFGQTFKTFGFYTEYIEDNVPLKWNKKVSCEIYG